MPFPFANAAMSEHKIQNDGRNALAGRCLNFRANVGSGWTGTVTRVSPTRIVIDNPRPFSSGLPAGFADTFGLTPVVVTQDMVGQTIGVFHAIEYKSAKGKAAQVQANFLQAVRDHGGRAGLAKSVADAVRIALGDVA